MSEPEHISKILVRVFRDLREKYEKPQGDRPEDYNRKPILPGLGGVIVVWEFR